MLRYAAALVVALLLSPALADSLGSIRDANLAHLDSFCPYVWVGTGNAAVTGMEAELQQQIQDKAILYDFPLHNPCKQGDARVVLMVIPESTACALQLAVAVEGDSNWAFPTVWSDNFVATSAPAGLGDQIRSVTTKAFEDLVLAWKKQRQP